MVPLGAGGFVGLIGDDHEQHAGSDSTAGFLGRLEQPLRGRREGGRRVYALAETEVVIGVLRRERHAGIRRARANDLHVRLRDRADAAIFHLEVLALEVAMTGSPQIAQHLSVLAEVLVTVAEEFVARPHAHLAVLGLLPAGHQIHPEAAIGNRVDGRGHARHDGRRQGEGSGGGEQLDLAGDSRQPRHQREGLQVVLPEFGLTAKAAQLDHRQREIETVALGLLHDGLVEFEGRHVLRRVFGNEPAVVADRNENTNIHGKHLCTQWLESAARTWRAGSQRLLQKAGQKLNLLIYQ